MIENIWVEKYRPKKFKGVIGNEHLKKILEKFEEKGEIPNILLYGPPGTGKTTIAKIIIKTFDCEYLFMNGSDENGIDVIRNKVGTFASSVGFSKFKIVFIDEADYVSQSAQSAMRNLIETNSDTTRFIFTCNYPEKLMEPLLSRFQVIEVRPNNPDDMFSRGKLILEKEGIEYSEEDLKSVVNISKPDMRRMIQLLQQNSFSGKLELGSGGVMNDSYILEIVEMLKKKNTFEDIRKTLTNVPVLNYIAVYKALFDSTESFCKKGADQVRLDIAEYMYRDAFVVDKEINLSALIIKILKQL